MTLVCCSTALPTWLKCCSPAVLLLVWTISLQMRRASYISSINSAKESHSHSSKVRFNHASRIFPTTFSCRMQLSACGNNSCVGTVMGSVLSLPACAFVMVERAIAVDHGKCQAFLWAWTHNCFTSSIHFQTTQWVPLRSGRLPYLCFWTIELLALAWVIRSRAAMIFCLTTSLAALISPFPVPQCPRYLHASSRFIAWWFSPLIVCPSLQKLNHESSYQTQPVSSPPLKNGQGKVNPPPCGETQTHTLWERYNSYENENVTPNGIGCTDIFSFLGISVFDKFSQSYLVVWFWKEKMIGTRRSFLVQIF